MKIIFHKLFPYAPYLNEYIGIEMDFPDTLNQDSFNENVDKLRELTENNHKKKYPHLAELSSIPQSNEPIPSEDRGAKERLEIDIDNATTIAELNVLKQDAQKHDLFYGWFAKYEQLSK